MRNTLIQLLLFLVVAGVLAWCSIRAQAWYHRWQMKIAWQDIHSEEREVQGLIAIGNEESHRRRQHHLDQLVTLGELSQRRFVCRHLQVGDRTGRHFVKVLYAGRPPKSVDWTCNWSRTPTPLRLDVVCENSELAAWQAFVSRCDVPSYWDIRDRTVQTADEPAQ